jgi:glycine hydroxymethyltransferase
MRIGTPAMTTRGVREKDMEKIVELIDEVLMNNENETRLKAVKKKVNTMMKKFPLYS